MFTLTREQNKQRRLTKGLSLSLSVGEAARRNSPVEMMPPFTDTVAAGAERLLRYRGDARTSLYAQPQLTSGTTEKEQWDS